MKLRIWLGNTDSARILKVVRVQSSVALLVPLDNNHPDTRSHLRLREYQWIELSQPGRNPVLDLAWWQSCAWICVLAVVGLVVYPNLLEVAEKGVRRHLGSSL